MTIIKSFPTRRKLLIEKSSFNAKTRNKNLYLLEFFYKNELSEKFIIGFLYDSIPITSRVLIRYDNQDNIPRMIRPGDMKIEWDPIFFTIKENLNENNGEMFAKWISQSVKSYFDENIKKTKAKNIIIRELYDNEMFCDNQKWILTGCLIDSLDMDNELTVSLSFNHCIIELKSVEI